MEDRNEEELTAWERKQIARIDAQEEAEGYRVELVRQLLVERDAYSEQVAGERTWIAQYDEERFVWVGTMPREKAEKHQDEMGRLPIRLFKIEEFSFADAWIESDVTHVCLWHNERVLPLAEPNSLRRFMRGGGIN